MPRPSATHTIPTGSCGGAQLKVHVHVWEPPPGRTISGTVVTVHPWSALGGGEHNTIGVARELAASGLRALTFRLKSGSAVWGLCTAHAKEVGQVVDVTAWAERQYGRPVVLLGSSAGAPISGSALPKLPKGVVSAFVAVGYTFGRFAAIGFGRHFGDVLSSDVPKIFVQGEKDEFTSPSQLESHARMAKGSQNRVHVVPGVGHFELESPSYDREVASIVVDWFRELPLPEMQLPTELGSKGP